VVLPCAEGGGGDVRKIRAGTKADWKMESWLWQSREEQILTEGIGGGTGMRESFACCVQGREHEAGIKAA
jgi:hypothetical protein